MTSKRRERAALAIGLRLRHDLAAQELRQPTTLRLRLTLEVAVVLVLGVDRGLLQRIVSGGVDIHGL